MGGAAKNGRRVSHEEGMRVAGEVLKWLKPLLKKAEIAGSLRRGKPEAGDVDLVVIPKNEAALNAVLGVKFGWQIGDPTKAKHSGLWDGVQIDVAVATSANWGAKLAFLTGSAEWNVVQRSRAKRMGLLLNEKGCWKLAGTDTKGKPIAGELVAGKTEEELYEAIGMPWREPKDREADLRGER